MKKIWSNWNTHTLLEEYNLLQLFWTEVWHLLIKLNTYSPYDTKILLLHCYPEEMKTYVRISFIHNSQIQKELKCPSMCEWLNKWWYTYAMESCHWKKNKYLFIHALLWMDFKINMFTERNPRKGCTYCTISFQWIFKTDKWIHCSDRDKIGAGLDRGGELSEKFLHLYLAIIKWAYSLVKIYQSMHLRCIDFINVR